MNDDDPDCPICGSGDCHGHLAPGGTIATPASREDALRVLLREALLNGVAKHMPTGWTAAAIIAVCEETLDRPAGSE